MPKWFLRAAKMTAFLPWPERESGSIPWRSTKCRTFVIDAKKGEGAVSARRIPTHAHTHNLAASWKLDSQAFARTISAWPHSAATSSAF